MKIHKYSRKFDKTSVDKTFLWTAGLRIMLYKSHYLPSGCTWLLSSRNYFPYFWSCVFCWLYYPIWPPPPDFWEGESYLDSSSNSCSECTQQPAFLSTNFPGCMWKILKFCYYTQFSFLFRRVITPQTSRLSRRSIVSILYYILWRKKF